MHQVPWYFIPEFIQDICTYEIFFKIFAQQFFQSQNSGISCLMHIHGIWKIIIQIAFCSMVRKRCRKKSFYGMFSYVLWIESFSFWQIVVITVFFWQLRLSQLVDCSTPMRLNATKKCPLQIEEKIKVRL